MITLISILAAAAIVVWLIAAWTTWRVRRVNRMLHHPELLPRHLRAKHMPAPWLAFVAEAEVEWQVEHYGRHAAGNRPAHAQG